MIQIPSRTERLSGWGRAVVESTRVYRPEKSAGVGATLRHGPEPHYVSRGLGRSYGDAALNGEGAVISHVRLDRMLAFDPGTGVLECEAGVSLADIIDVFLPRGFFPPVIPGTKHVTVGGAIASDVHGKNHHVDGTFGDYVLDLRLRTPIGDELLCSRDENERLFRATTGGMGLTGAILSARIRLRRVGSAYVRVDYSRTAGLDETLAALARPDTHRYSVAWIDCLAGGRRFGRAVLMEADDAGRDDLDRARIQAPLGRRAQRSARVPFDARVVHDVGVRAFNTLYYAAHRPARRVVDYGSHFFPLDRMEEWNRLYGPRGFMQYQVALPTATAEAGVAALFERMRSSGHASYLAVLKRFGPAGAGLLSFPIEGYTLALDVPNRAGTKAFLRELDTITLAHAGRTYLAKDVTLTPDAFETMYPNAPEFRAVKRQVDPDGRLSSTLGRRVGLS